MRSTRSANASYVHAFRTNILVARLRASAVTPEDRRPIQALDLLPKRLYSLLCVHHVLCLVTARTPNPGSAFLRRLPALSAALASIAATRGCVSRSVAPMQRAIARTSARSRRTARLLQRVAPARRRAAAQISREYQWRCVPGPADHSPFSDRADHETHSRPRRCGGSEGSHAAILARIEAIFERNRTARPPLADVSKLVAGTITVAITRPCCPGA